MNKIPQKKDHNDFLKKKLFNIEKHFIVAIQKRMDIFFDALKGILFVFEQSSVSDYKQSLNYVALNKVIENEKEVYQKFISSVQSAFKYFLQAEYNFFINENLHVGNFQKNTSKDKQNEYTIVSDLISKVEENEKHLATLRNFYTTYATNKKLHLNQLPISPYVLMYSLMSSIEEMDLNTGIRLVMYNAFDINVLNKLSVIYADLVSKYKLDKVKTAVESEVNQDVNETDGKYAIIEKILNRHHQTDKTEVDDKPLINHDLIIQTLNILQEKVNNKSNRSENYYLSPQKLPRLLNEGIQKLDKNSAFMKYNKKDSNSIQLVVLLFKYIETDGGIRNRLRQVLLKMQIPVLIMVLKGEAIFKNISHPLRLLLNQMSLVPIGFSDELTQDHKYIVKLNEIVSVIVNQTENKIELFQKQNEALDAYIEKMHKRFNLIQNRIKEKEVGLEKISQTKEKVKQILEQKMHKKHMPISIKDLLLGVWQNVLVLEFLRHPETSRACLSKVEFIDLLLNNINKETIDNNTIKEIVDSYAEGLGLVAFNSKEQRDKKNELMRLLNKGRKQQVNETSGDASHDSKKLILYKKQELTKPQHHRKENHKNDDYDKLVQSIQVGTWLQFISEDNKKLRAKVSWISPITHNFLLVNSDGVRLADKSLDEIAEAFRNNKCTELQIIPLFDRALLKIAKDLNES